MTASFASDVKALIREKKRQNTIATLKALAEEMRGVGASPASIKKAIEGFYVIFKTIGDLPVSQQKLNDIAGSPSAPDLKAGTPGHLLSEVETQHINWLWHRRIPLGKITIVDGDPGMGKSLLAINIAARVSTGQPMPDGTPGKQGAVILIAPEDGAGDTLKPRLEAAGGDPSQVLLLNTLECLDSKKLQIVDRPFALSDDLETLENAIKAMKATLVILDPLTAILGYNIDASRDQAIREVFTPLAQVAERSGCAMLIIRHLSKVNPTNPLYRGAGSIGIIAAARTGLIVASHPDNPNQRILATTKNNLSKPASNLVFHVVENTDGLPYIQWLGACDLTLSTLFSTGTNLSTLRQEILTVLKDSMTPLGPQAIAERTGYNHNTIRQTLRRMLTAQEISSVARGQYTTPHHPYLTKQAKANSDVTTEQVSQVSLSH